MHCAQKNETHRFWQWVRRDLETRSRSIKPECQNIRLHNSNTCYRNRRAFASGGSWIQH